MQRKKKTKVSKEALSSKASIEEQKIALSKALAETEAGKELQTIDNGQLVQQEDFTAIAEQRIDTIGRVIKIALKNTNNDDWVCQGPAETGKPYLCGSGAEKIARCFGVFIPEPDLKREDRKDEKGEHYIYICKGIVSLPTTHDKIFAIGTCTSRDQFFAQRYNKKTKEKYMLPLSEIDEGNIMKSAYTNFCVNGITRLLGLRNLSWKDLDDHGLDSAYIKNSRSISYKKGGTTQTRQESKPTIQDPDALLTDKQKYFIENRIIKSHLLSDVEKEGLREQIKDMTKGVASKFIDEWQGILERRREAEKKNKKEKTGKETEEEPPSQTDNAIKQATLVLFNAVVESKVVIGFEAFMIHKTLNADDTTDEKAKKMLQFWTKEIDKRYIMKREDEKQFNEYLFDQTAKLVEKYPDDYKEFKNK